MRVAPFKFVPEQNAFRVWNTIPKRTWTVELVLVGSKVLSGEQESLSCLMHVAEPEVHDRPALVLAALERLHALLGEQIETMRSSGDH